MKARASDSWAYYQAEDVKRHLSMVVAGLQPKGTSTTEADADKYERRALQLRSQAEDFDLKSDEADAESRRALAPHGMLAIAMTFIQIAIALASISALTKRRWLLTGGGLFAAVGLSLSIAAWF